MNFTERNYKTNDERTKESVDKFDKSKLLKLLVGNNETPIIFDVGANQGQSVEYYRRLFPNCIIHCFEPDTDTFKTLSENCKGLENVFLNNFGIGSETNTLEFYKHDINSEMNGFIKVNTKSKDSISLNSDKSEEYKTKINHISTAKIMKLCDYINDNKIDKIDLLKLDTQGFEEECLKGIENNFDKINVILTEIMFYDLYEKSVSFYDLEKYLIPNNFKLYDISHMSKNPMNGRLDWVDAIYTKNYSVST